MKLEEIRQRIDAIDSELVSLLEKRMECTALVGEYKKEKNLPIGDAAREEEVLGRLTANVKEENLPYIEELYRALFSISKKQQSRICSGISTETGRLVTPSYGLLGKSLSHTVSPFLHSLLGNPDYGIFEIEESRLEEFLVEGRFKGINVTIPYKEKVIPYCSHIEESADQIGAVNTIVNNSGILYGYNTDYHGFMYLLEREGISLRGANVIIMGSGGTCKTVVAAVSHLKVASITILSRNGGLDKAGWDGFDIIWSDYDSTEVYSNGDILINTTPLGMYPNIDTMACRLSLFSNLKYVIDVVYNPIRSRLVIEAERLGIKAVGGLAMLAAQGYISEQLLSGQKGCIIEEAYEKLALSMSNPVLIGMPGSGKTTIGRLVAAGLERQFVDSDEEFLGKYGVTSECYIERYGEDSFRDKESEIIREISLKKGIVIALGGGSVLREENTCRIKGNGVCFYIDRPVDELDTEGRPLSRGQNGIPHLRKMYAARKPYYSAAMDYHVTNDNPEKASDCIIKLYYKHFKGEDRR